MKLIKKSLKICSRNVPRIIAVVITSVSVLAVSLRWVGSDADFVGLTGGDECVPAYKHQSMYTVIFYFQPHICTVYINILRRLGVQQIKHQIYLELYTFYLAITYYLVKKRFLMFCALKFEHFPISL